MTLSVVFRLFVVGALGVCFRGVALGQIFSNPAPILIPATGDGDVNGAPAGLYPSAITVSGIPTSITSVRVYINDFRHHFPADVDMLLVSPSGKKIVIWSDVGSSFSTCGATCDNGANPGTTGVSVILDDGGVNSLPTGAAISTGTYKPTNNAAGDLFPAPAPAAPYQNPAPAGAATFANTFNGDNPNGTWLLYVVDDNTGDSGRIQGGWGLEIAATFTNPIPILVPAAGGSGSTTGAPADPYPTTVVVSGLPTITKGVVVNINDFRHHFPDDVDMLLVSPTGKKMVIWSDVGGTNSTCGATCDNGANLGTTGVTIQLDDTSVASLPDTGALNSQNYLPTDYGTGDLFPAPAPAGPYQEAAPAGSATFANTFNGDNPNGNWHLFVVDDLAGDSGRILGGWSLTVFAQAPATTAGQLIISEFRLRGPSGANDEFIELYNTLNVPLITQSADGSTGLAVVASDGTTRCIVPNGTSIPAHGHFLCTNSSGYSLGNYPAGSGATATGDQTYTNDIADNAGIALFNGAIPGNFNVFNRLDAVGSASEANPIYKEGTGYPALTPFSINYSFVRKLDPVTGLPIDTGNNAGDFVFLDTNGTSAGAGQRLGAPGPQNLSSPVFGSGITVSAVDPGCPGNGASSSACGVARDLTSVPANNSTFGTLSIRRKITNNTGVPLTRLRFRVTNLSTFPEPFGVSDLRVLTSPTFIGSLSGGGTTQINGLTLDTPPPEPNGAGINSSVSAGTVTFGTPLAAGASIDVNFLLGIQQTGTDQVSLEVEAAPQGGALFSVSGNTEDCLTQTCPGNITKNADPNQCGAIVTYSAPALTGTCPASNCTPASGSFFPKGVTPVTCTSSTAATCSFNVTVTDNQSPSITCPANVTQQVDAGKNSAVVNYNPPQVLDNCPGVGAPVCMPASGSSFPIGTTIVNCSVTDASNLQSNCSFNVNVIPAGATPSPTPTGTPTATPTPTPATTTQTLNISTRMQVQGGNNVLIAGFIITGNAPKAVAVRGIGPSLAQFFSGTLADPTLELHSGSTTLAANDNWQDDPAQAAQLSSHNLAPADPKESAILASLPPQASYTAILAGKGGDTGIGVAEIYDLDKAADAQLANISSRGFVLTDNNVMIGGFILGANPNNTRVAVRGIGPSLSAFGLSPLLEDPTVELHDSNGTTLASNDNWQDDPVQAAQLSANGLAPADPKEAAIFFSLAPGQYTAILAGKNGGTGIGVVEIFNIH